MEKEENKQSNDKKVQQDPAVERGEAAIRAARLVDPQPEDKQQQKEREDAEKWRNEG